MIVRPVTLEGQFIRLEPLGMEHRPALCAVAFDEDIWRWATVSMQTPDEMRRYIETALRWQREGSALPFAITLQRTGQAVGSTRFANIDTSNRRLEIGWTWLARPWQRTAANTEAKYLLLSHAFEELGAVRVEFKTDTHNAQSRRALQRIGAREEGTLRSHMLLETGRIRDSVYYSIIAPEWPAVKVALEQRLTA